MRHSFSLCTLCCVVILGGACVLAAFGAPQGTLSVGAARVDITPPADAALPMSGYNSRKEGFQKIHDHIYARAIVLSDGTHEVGILSWELIGMPDGVWQNLSQRISKELGIPADHVILAGEHVHSAPTVAGVHERYARNDRLYGETGGLRLPGGETGQSEPAASAIWLRDGQGVYKHQPPGGIPGWRMGSGV